MAQSLNLPFLIAVIFLVAGSAIVLWAAFGERLEIARKLNRRLFDDEEEPQDDSLREKVERLVVEDRSLGRLDGLLKPKDEEQESRIRKRLIRAGYRRPDAVRVYLVTKWSVALAGLVLGVVLFSVTLNPVEPILPILSVAILVLISLFAADMWVERRVVYRRMAIEKAFPDALDLLLVCIEAGHGLDQGLARVARELKGSSTELSEELQLIVSQLRAGREREHVLADFLERTGVEDVRAFVTILRQADQFGVSIGDTLRVFAAEMRNKRFMRAEETANLMPVKLALGAIMFTVPPTMMILIGPSIIMIVREMASAASGG